MVAHAISPEGSIHKFPLPSPAQQPDNDSAAIPDTEHKKAAGTVHYWGFR